MMYIRQWVTMLVAVMAISMVSASAVYAQSESIVTPWSNPGSFPFAGDYSDVCALYSEELSEEQCARALLAFENNSCEMYSLQEGDVIDVSFTSDRHYRKVLQVAFGDEVVPDDPMRNALVCDTGRLDGLKLIRPEVCGNWSLMTIREPELPIVVTQSVQTVQITEQYGCWLQARHRHGVSGDITFLPGFEASGFCELPHFIPGLLLEGAALQSNGQGLVCGWYPIQHQQ